MNLQSNSEQMKSVVETFVLEDTQELIYDNEKLEKWHGLIEELGLEGQTKIAEPEKSPIPFLFMKTSLERVFEILCPRKVKVKDFDVSPIPVEILDVIALSVREKYFDELEIWYDDKDPDPVCVGTNSTFYGYVGNTWNSEDRREGLTREAVKELIGESGNVYVDTKKRYLLGRWADVKKSFEELKEMAIKRYMDERGNRAQVQIKDAQRVLDGLREDAFEYFG